MQKKELPVLNEKYMLPTGKHSISYSEAYDWLQCSFRHKLKHIDKILLDKPSIHTEFGSSIHDTLEEFIMTRHSMTEEVVEKTIKDFSERMLKLKEIDPSLYSEKEIEEFSQAIGPILKQVPGWLDETFPGWLPVATEWNLFEEVQNQKEKYFKGFIDCIIKVPVKQRKAINKNSPMRLSELTGEDHSNDEYQTIILDWKTTSFGWTPDKKRDFQKQLQLVLYKHFWCKLNNLDLTQVKTGFVLLKRTPKKDGSRCEFVPVSVGPKTEEKALDIVQNMINQLQQRRFVKNRNSCMYCVYSGTKYCI
jgi:hypothetical protein